MRESSRGVGSKVIVRWWSHKHTHIKYNHNANNVSTEAQELKLRQQQSSESSDMKQEQLSRRDGQNVAVLPQIRSTHGSERRRVSADQE